jgi:FkbM family methyltransferase
MSSIASSPSDPLDELTVWLRDLLGLSERGQISYYVHSLPLEEHGSEPGNWRVPADLLDNHSVVYAVGAGTDWSFDVSLAASHGAQIEVFDPSPEAQSHWDAINEALTNGRAIGPAARHPETPYPLNQAILKRITFHPYGLWEKSGEAEFFHFNPATGPSASLVNLEKQQRSFEGPVKTLQEVMTQQGHEEIDILKLNIEGAEYNVLKTVLDAHLSVRVILVEYDEAFFPQDDEAFSRIQHSIEKIVEAGYYLVEIESNLRCTFVRKDVYAQLLGH